AADLHLDGPPAARHQAARPLAGDVRLDGADDEFEANAAVAAEDELEAHSGVGGHGWTVAAAEEFVDGHAEDLPLQVEQGHLDGGAGEGVAEGRLLHAAADPFAVEGVGADDERGEDLADHGDGAGLGFAAPDGGDAGLAESDVAGLVSDADDDVVADDVLAQRRDDGDFAFDAALDGFGGDDGDRHGGLLRRVGRGHCRGGGAGGTSSRNPAETAGRARTNRVLMPATIRQRMR